MVDWVCPVDRSSETTLHLQKSRKELVSSVDLAGSDATGPAPIRDAAIRPCPRRAGWLPNLVSQIVTQRRTGCRPALESSPRASSL